MVDICLIPEVPFTLPKLLEHINKILDAKGHCVVCVAEGAGQNLAQVLAMFAPATTRMEAQRAAEASKRMDGAGRLHHAAFAAAKGQFLASVGSHLSSVSPAEL